MAVDVIMPQMGGRLLKGRLFDGSRPSVIRSTGMNLSLKSPPTRLMRRFQPRRREYSLRSRSRRRDRRGRHRGGDHWSGGRVGQYRWEAAPVAVAAAAAPVAASAASGAGLQGLTVSELAARGMTSAADLRRVRSTPVVRKIAAEHGIDISLVAGSMAA